jgi:hypothetical protein
MYHIFFILSSVDGHQGWFHNFAIVTVNTGAVNMDMQVSSMYADFSSLSYTHNWYS